MPNTNKPYPESIQEAIKRYRAWARRPEAERDAEEEAAAFAQLEDACYAHSYAVGEVMFEERL